MFNKARESKERNFWHWQQSANFVMDSNQGLNHHKLAKQITNQKQQHQSSKESEDQRTHYSNSYNNTRHPKRKMQSML